MGSGEWMQVKWLAKALKNLDDEAEFIASEDPTAARLVVQRIVSAVNLLAETPNLGRPGRIAGTRELVVPNTRYIIPYRINSGLQQIEILRVFHTSRRLPGQW